MTGRKIHTQLMKRGTISTNHSQLYTCVKTISLLSKTNLILANAPGKGELRVSITSNNFSAFKFWGGGSLNIHGSFLLTHSIRYFYITTQKQCNEFQFGLQHRRMETFSTPQGFLLTRNRNFALPRDTERLSSLGIMTASISLDVLFLSLSTLPPFHDRSSL